MNCFKIPSYDEDPSDRMVDWLNTFGCEQWEGDDSGILLYGPNDEEGELCVPGDWITECGGRLVRLPAGGRKLHNCQMDDDSERQILCWPLFDGTAVYLYNGVEPRLTILAVTSDRLPGIWIPEGKK